MNYEAIKTRFDTLVKESTHITMPPQGIRGAAINVLENACGGKENRYLITRALCGKVHTAEFEIGEWDALLKFVDPNKNPMTNKWEGRENLVQMCGIVLTHVAEQEGQLAMFEPVLAGRLKDVKKALEAE